MRKVIVSNVVSLDGCYAGPNGEIDWFVTDEQFFNYSVALLKQVDTLLYGRVTYEGMASYWPTPEAVNDNPGIGELMNSRHKIVFSDTLTSADWNNSTLVKGDAAAAIAQLKQQAGQDMVIFGSGQLVASLAQSSVIDQYQLVVCPVALGQGKGLFGANRVNLKLAQSQPFSSGSILITYLPA